MYINFLSRPVFLYLHVHVVYENVFFYSKSLPPLVGCCSLSGSEFGFRLVLKPATKTRRRKCAHVHILWLHFCNLQQEKDVAHRWHYYAATTSSGDFCPLAIVSHAFPENVSPWPPAPRHLQYSACSYLEVTQRALNFAPHTTHGNGKPSTHRVHLCLIVFCNTKLFTQPNNTMQTEGVRVQGSRGRAWGSGRGWGSGVRKTDRAMATVVSYGAADCSCSPAHLFRIYKVINKREKPLKGVFSPPVYEINFHFVFKRVAGSFGLLKIWKSMRAIRVFYWIVEWNGMVRCGTSGAPPEIAKRIILSHKRPHYTLHWGAAKWPQWNAHLSPPEKGCKYTHYAPLSPLQHAWLGNIQSNLCVRASVCDSKSAGKQSLLSL